MIKYYICAGVTTLSALVRLGFSIEAFVKSSSNNDTSNINAMYTLSRNA